MHLVGLLFGGGLALGAGRETLLAMRGAPETRHEVLDDLGRMHRPVVAALAAVFASGVPLAAADIKTFVASPIFWTKLALVALLLVNGLVMVRTVASLRAELDTADALGREPTPRLWTPLPASAWVSLALWVATTVAGTALAVSG